MEDTTVVVCNCANQVTNRIFEMGLNDWVTAGISIITLLLNILFYIIIAPHISFRFQKKADFLKYASELITYLSEINSLETFDGVPTKVKSYCVSIELLFKSGIAPEPLHSNMEKIFQAVKQRKSLLTEQGISDWESDFRKKTHELRKSLAKYTGVF